MADRGLKLKIQYWTSRGFAYLDVDYRGSWGYGRDYREALDGKWGVADVEDVVAATQHLVRAGLGDGDRLVISGGSAGGFTVLCALTFHDLFAAGASYYGIGDLQKLADLTHKFEAGYIYALTGTEPGRTAEVFEARSPLAHAERLSRPVIFFQGLDDKVVPPGQSRDMVASLKERGVPCAYLEFEGEGHGFRRAETIVRALRSEYAFYARVLGLGVREDAAPVDIFNEERLQ
jgi:dipeptidyl aminopeptidase/acylaminoacyl peptidase